MSDYGIPAFPKIFNLGTSYVKDVLNEPVEITEKVDGSQFAFGKTSDGELIMRSKGRRIYPEALSPKDMFTPVVDYVQTLDLPSGLFFYCEYLMKRKHNVLHYDRIPENMLALFGIMGEDGAFDGSGSGDQHASRVHWAGEFRIDCVPTLAVKKINSAEEIQEFMGTISYLGGAKIEGVVIKNYARPFLLGGQPIPLMSAKHVCKEFKEVHRKSWKGDNTGKGKWETFMDCYRTDARWQKAVQHLNEAGQLDNEPKDIGKLIFEVKRDITDEEKESIKGFLWKEFGPQLLRRSTAGFPEWYKEQLLQKAFA